MFTALFWKNLTERVVSSAAGGALAGLGVVTVIDSTRQLLAAATGAGTAALFSLLKGLAATRLNNPESPSLVDLRPDDEPGRHAEDRVR